MFKKFQLPVAEAVVLKTVALEALVIAVHLQRHQKLQQTCRIKSIITTIASTIEL